MNTIIKLEKPLEVITTTKYLNFKIREILVNLNSGASFVVLLYGETEDVILCKTIDMSGEDYQKWGNNDDYVIAYVKSKLLTLKTL
jgi:hypothetical protein